MHCVLLWEARPRGEAFWLQAGLQNGEALGGLSRLKGCVRRGSRLPQKSASPHKSALCTACFCGRPALGAKLFGSKRACRMANFLGRLSRLKGCVRRGSRLPQKACHLRESALCTACFVGGPPSGRSFLAPSGLAEWRSFGAFEPTQKLRSPRVAPPTEKRATCANRRYARRAFVGDPPSVRSFLGSKQACRMAIFLGF